MRKTMTAILLAAAPLTGLALSGTAQAELTKRQWAQTQQRYGNQPPRTPAAPDRNQNVRPQAPGEQPPTVAPGAPPTGNDSNLNPDDESVDGDAKKDTPGAGPAPEQKLPGADEGQGPTR